MIRLDVLQGRDVAVMGLGRSGLATAQALLASGARVHAWDDGAAARAAAQAAGIPLRDLAAHDFGGTALLVLSPGIPHSHPAPHPVAARARAAGVPIVGDIELLFQAHTGGRFIGITGTNGKSTTTALIGHILRRAGGPVAVGGNLGTPVLSFEPIGPGGHYVLEMSSYQLELIPSAVFDVAVLLNISPDHLARHGGMDGYVAAKRAIFRNQGPGQTAIISIDDPWCRRIRDELVGLGRSRVIAVSVQRPVPGGISVTGTRLVDDTGGRAEAVLDLAALATLPGPHNWQNALAAYAAARAAGIPLAEIREGLHSFPGLAHRQQLVATIAGVRFVNDSKATNADAAAKALACYEPIYWILGGLPKETLLDGLEPLMPRVRHAFLIGAATDAFARWLDGRVPYTRCGDLDTAVARAAEAAFAERSPGATVLLSPACASFDQFANFEARGDAFIRCVRALAEARGMPPAGRGEAPA